MSGKGERKREREIKRRNEIHPSIIVNITNIQGGRWEKENQNCTLIYFLYISATENVSNGTLEQTALVSEGGKFLFHQCWMRKVTE